MTEFTPSSHTGRQRCRRTAVRSIATIDGKRSSTCESCRADSNSYESCAYFTVRCSISPHASPAARRHVDRTRCISLEPFYVAAKGLDVVLARELPDSVSWSRRHLHPGALLRSECGMGC